MQALFEGIGGLYAFLAVLVVMLAVLTSLIRKSATTRPFLGNILIPCVFVAIAVLFYLMSLGFPEEEAGPSAIPHLWITALILLSVFLIVQALFGKTDPDPGSGRLDMVALFIGTVIAYLFLMQIIGYYLSTFLFLAAVMYFLSYRKYLTIITVSGGWLLFAYLVFQRMLYIPLPQGKLIEMVLE